MRFIKSLSAAGTALVPCAAFAIVTGALDPTFGTGGKVNVAGYGVAVQADGKIVALGAASTAAVPFPNFSGSISLARLTSSGGVDFSRTDTIGGCGFCSAATALSGGLALQPDGAIVVTGAFESATLNTGACRSGSFIVRRYLGTGSPDAGFGSAGQASFPAGYGQSVAMQADGKIVAAGIKKYYGDVFCGGTGGRDDQMTVRLTAAGVGDAAFGTSGVVVSPSAAGGDDAAMALAIRPDGKVVTVGYAAATGATKSWTITLYDAAGVQEATAVYDLSLGDDVAYAIAMQADGNFVVGGSAGPSFVLARFTAPATYDAGFGAAGRVAGPGAAIRGLALQPDGKIVAAMADGDVLRFGANGAQDASFGIGGRVSTGMTGVLSLALQADGKIVVGSATQVARIDPAASVPISPVPTIVDFLGQSLNTTSPSQLVTLTNNTGSSQTVSSITATVGFAVTHDCTTLAPAAHCTASVTYTPVFEGPNAGDLVVTGTGGTQKVYLLGTGEKSLVTHYYRSILRRAPDAPGKAFWQGEAARMQSIGANVNEAWFAMAQFFFFSAEYLNLNRNDGEFVTDLYTTFFNRAPDGGGLGFWTANLQQGMPREVLLASFMFSTEFANFTQAIFGNTAARAEVDVVMDFYRGLLARLPDPGGFTAWVNNFRTAQCAGAPGAAVNAMVEAISSGFIGSGEYVGRNRTNAQYVGDLYNAFLRRGGDLGGVQFWINDLNASTRTRENVRQNFIASGEFQGRVTAIVNQGCMP